MSVEAMNWAIHQPVKTPSQKLILLLFANRANPHTGECWPGIQSVANQACLSTRQAQRVINELCELGLVSKTPRSGGHYGRQTNLYQLKLGVNLQGDNMSHCRISKVTSGVSNVTPTSVQPDTHVTLNQREPKDKKPKRGRRSAPADFEVTPELTAWASTKNLSVDLDSETEKFKNHEFDKPKRDWNACWRNWILRANEWESKRAKPSESYLTRLTRYAAEFEQD